MKLYELSYLIAPDLQEDEMKMLQEKVNGFIIENQGTLDRIEDIVKRRLPSGIKRQTSAYLATVNFYLEPEKLSGLKEKVKSENKIINSLIFNKKPRKAIEAPTRIRPAISEPPSRAQEKAKKVGMKEIEKKLEEILGE